jgi:NDP-sugar pyrophosphorylase family protein
MKELIISAGGVNARMRDYLACEFNGIPKPILPLPGKNSTLIEEIIRNAEPFFEQFQIHANDQNATYLSRSLKKFSRVEIVIDTHRTGPVGPQIRALLEKKSRIYGCAGDFYCKFGWPDFELFHESHDRPVSILVAPSISVYQGAVFRFDGSDTVLAWKRRARTGRNCLINIGVQIIDYTPELEEIAGRLEKHFFTTLIKRGLIKAYRLPTIGFNINTPHVYTALCRHLS